MTGRKPDERWAQLRRRGIRFTTADANEIGLSPPVLSQAVRRGQIERKARGEYEFVEDYRPGKPPPTKRARLATLRLANFTVFEEASFEFCPGINVLIGENGTGKSHAMLAAYSLLRGFHKGASIQGVEARVQEKLKGVFKPQDRQLSRLVRRAVGGGAAEVEISGAGESSIRFTHREADRFEAEQVGDWPVDDSIFIPSRELLAMYEGFIGAYQQLNLSFSEVYYDTCVALNAPLAKGSRKTEAAALLEPLYDALGGKVLEKSGRFYVQQGRANLEAHLVSEGLRKLATVTHLINNGSLEENDVLFWDEPEANLNPALSKVVVDFLVEIAKRGVQVVLATHDYTITTRLSILAENGVVGPDLIRFFSLARTHGRTSPVAVTHANTLAGLPSDPILREHEALYAFELSGGES